MLSLLLAGLGLALHSSDVWLDQGSEIVQTFALPGPPQLHTPPNYQFGTGSVVSSSPTNEYEFKL